MFADMAQQVEHVLGKDEVTGSNPVISSTKHRRLILWCFLFVFCYYTFACARWHSQLKLLG